MKTSENGERASMAGKERVKAAYHKMAVEMPYWVLIGHVKNVDLLPKSSRI